MSLKWLQSRTSTGRYSFRFCLSRLRRYALGTRRRRYSTISLPGRAQLHYRKSVGATNHGVEEALWTALRALEEKPRSRAAWRNGRARTTACRSKTRLRPRRGRRKNRPGCCARSSPTRTRQQKLRPDGENLNNKKRNADINEPVHAAAR
jgi:hypothetical protein